MNWLFIVVMVMALFAIPISLPGLWIMTGVSVIAWLMHYMSFMTLIAIVAIAIVAELIEFVLVGRLTKQYGGSRKAFWGAVLGGAAGVLMGAPIPIIGSIIAGFAGSFLGAAAVTYAETRHVGSAHRVGMGAVFGRALTAVAKTAAGLAILVIATAALLH